MSRYIDVDALEIGRANPDVFIREEYARGWNLAIEIIENAPTADVVEVVRCKDCKHKVDYKGRVMCGRRAGRIGLEWYGLSATSNDNYCSYGERMDGET